MKNLTQAEIRQMQDAKALLQNSIVEHQEYVKIAIRLENNLRTFVDRTNFELASLARTIAQKEENIITLKKMVEGFFVEPTPPIISQAESAKPAQQEQAEPKAKPAQQESRGIPKIKDEGTRRGNVQAVPVQASGVSKEKSNGDAKHLETTDINPAKNDSDAEVAH